ncbi:MAG: hypothetical protein NTV33_03810 [Coprothermobacterota bacterium]|jgi:hypothetical protein|nr:hypothetical protein [Coprothermobacterota bacterium]
MLPLKQAVETLHLKRAVEAVHPKQAVETLPLKQTRANEAGVLAGFDEMIEEQ